MTPALIVDIDLAVLGSAPASFDEYERGIQSEYAWVPAVIFRQKRASILKSLLARRHVFHTPYFIERYESQARLNLERSVAMLERGFQNEVHA